MRRGLADDAGAAAKAGVPANRMFTWWEAPGLGPALHGLTLLLGQLGQFGGDALLFQARQLFDEYAADQMIHFVLDTHGHQSVSFEYALAALFIHRFDCDFCRTGDFFVDPGDRKTTFFRFLNTILFNNDRIY